MKRPSDVVKLETSDSYIPECAAWYTAGVIVILLRFATRIRTMGLAGLRGDDYLSLLYLVLYTACIVIVVITYHSGSVLEVNDGNINLLTEEDIEILTTGSLIEYLSFFIYTGCIWSLKFSVLFFYNSLTLGVIRRKTIIFLSWLCGISYIVLCLTALLSCRPRRLSDNWLVKPRQGPECVYRLQNFWCLVVLNVITDAAILSIPVPILWHLRVPPLRKLGVALLLSSGLFVIGTALVRAWITISGQMSVIVINLWGFRELGVGLIAVTAPVIYPFFRPDFWVRGPYVPADRRRQLQFLRHRHHQRRPAGAGASDDDDDEDYVPSDAFRSGKPVYHDTAIELQSIDEQMTAFMAPDEDEDDEACTGPRSPPRRTISSSTTIVATEARSSRHASVYHGEGGPGAHARGGRPGSSGSIERAAIEETDWALQYMPN